MFIFGDAFKDIELKRDGTGLDAPGRSSERALAWQTDKNKITITVEAKHGKNETTYEGYLNASCSEIINAPTRSHGGRFIAEKVNI